MKLRFRATLLKPLDQQGDRDHTRIDPAGVEFDPEQEHPLFQGYSYRVPEDLVGKGRISRAGDGSLVFDGELNEGLFSKKAVEKGEYDTGLKLGGAYTSGRMHRDREMTIFDTATLISVALLREHIDPTQPSIIVRRDT